uniref:protein MMS22-like n=1 Tax=Styela clava TaxID=7725 RepID=UPI00193A2DA6|nr:protein MMS22-like [Styela clava]
MDFEGSLTPPLSPGILNSEPFVDSSPILGAKHRSVQHRDENLRKIDIKCVEYPGPVVCKRTIHRALYEIDSSFEETYVGNAHTYWNVVPFADITDSTHNCEDYRRNIMNENKCLSCLNDADECSDLFYQAMMYLQDLDDCVKIWMKMTNMNNIHYVNVAKKYRKLINETLSFVCEFVQSYNNEDEGNIDSIIQIVNMLVMLNNQIQNSLQNCLIGIAEEDIEVSEYDGRIKSTPLRELLHVYVDINSTFLKLLPLIAKFPSVTRNLDSIKIFYNNGIEIDAQDFHRKIIGKIITQTVGFAMEKYHKLSANFKNNRGQFIQSSLFNNTPFPCLCLQQLLVLCIYTISKLQTQKSTDNLDSMDTQSNVLDAGCVNFPLKAIAPSVWKTISELLFSIIQVSQSKRLKQQDSQHINGPSLPWFDHIQDSLSFCWWYTWHVAHLFSFDSTGNYQVHSVTSTSYLPILSRLIRLSLTSCDGDSKLLAAHLICYQAISSFWRKTSDTFSGNVTSAELAHFHLIWAHFSKKLNSVKQSDKSGINKYTMKEDKSLSPLVWITKCENYLKYEKQYLANESQHIYEDSFNRFLSIFGELLSIGCWGALKDRFYSKIQLNDMKNLNDTGMSRLYKIFILILLSSENDTERINGVKKLLEFLNSAYLGKTDYRKQKVMLTGLFSCVHLAVRFSIDMSAISTKCGKMMSFVFKLFSSSDQNMDARNSLWRIISFYLQNLSEICRSSSSFHLGQHLLIPASGFRIALSKTRSSESIIVLENISACITTFSSHLKHCERKESITGCVLLLQNIVNQSIPWIKEKSRVEITYSEEIVNVVTDLCLLLLQIKNTAADLPPISASLPNVVEDFSCSSEVKLRTRFLLLVGILSQENEEMVLFLNNKSVESDSCRSSVIQGCLKCVISHSNEKDQTRLVTSLLNIDVIKEIFNNPTSSINPCFNDFLCALGSRYDASKTFIERKERREQATVWFTPISDVIRSFSKSLTTTDRETTLNIYKTCGQIVHHCSRLLYASGKSGIIIQIIDTLILPLWIYSSQDKNAHLTVLRVIGHTLHMYIKGLMSLDYKRDSYVRRVMSDIFNIYLTRFPTATNSASHPFRQVLADIRTNLEHRTSIIRSLKDCCKTGPNSDTKLTMVIEILHSWSLSANSFVPEEIAEISQLIKQAKFTLRSLPAVMSKVNHMESMCNK